MPAEQRFEIKKSYDTEPEELLFSTNFFYSEYDPTKHFEYRVVFKWDSDLNKELPDWVATDKNKAVAYALTIQHHFSFELVLPKWDNNSTPYIRFYIPKISNGSLADYNYNFLNITQGAFEANLSSILQELPTKTDTLLNIMNLRNYQYYKYVEIEEGEVVTNKYIFDEDIGWYRLVRSGESTTGKILYKKTNQPETASESYLDMNIYKLLDVYEYINDLSTDNYKDATRINQHSYNTASYVRITRPSSESGYNFSKKIKLINSTFQFKLPSDVGWYKYNKFTKAWEQIIFKEENA